MSSTCFQCHKPACDLSVRSCTATDCGLAGNRAGERGTFDQGMACALTEAGYMSTAEYVRQVRGHTFHEARNAA